MDEREVDAEEKRRWPHHDLAAHATSKGSLDMGTRGLVGFKLNGEYYGAYKQYDTYPSSLGAQIVEFIQNKLNSHDSIAAFRKRVEGLIILDGEECRKDVPAELQKRYMDFADLDVSTKSPTEWYCLLRKLQGVN